MTHQQVLDASVKEKEVIDGALEAIKSEDTESFALIVFTKDGCRTITKRVLADRALVAERLLHEYAGALLFPKGSK